MNTGADFAIIGECAAKGGAVVTMDNCAISRQTQENSMRRYSLAFLTICSIVLPMVPVVQADTPAEPDFVVAAMRVEPKHWDKAHNFALLERYAKQGAERGATLVVTCEGFLDGYTSNPKYTPGLTREQFFEYGEPLDGPWLKRVGDLARDLKIFISVGFAERDGDQMHNSVAVFSPAGQVVLRYSKTHSIDEPFNTRGNDFPVAKTDLGTLGALICYDRRFPEVPRILALKGAQILLIPSYGQDGERNEALLRTRAWENSVWVVYVRQNQALVINPSGKIIARDKGEGDELVLARIDLGGEKGTGEIYKRRSPEIYRELLELQTPDRR
jgi:predicted amidohydrolase